MKVTLSSGVTLSYPIELRDVTQSIATFSVRTKDLDNLLPNDLRAVEYGYGLSEMYVFWLQTSDSDFGPFSEVQISFAAREPYYGRQSGYVFANPVSTEAARLASAELWGVRKELADIEIKTTAIANSCLLSMNGSEVLNITADTLSGEPCEIDAFASTAGKERSTVFRYLQRSGDCAHKTRPSGVSFSLGDHDLSNSLRALMIEPVVHRHSFHRQSHILMGPPLHSLLESPNFDTLGGAGA